MKIPIKVPFALVVGLVILNLLSACSTVKPYQKNKLNDSEMTLSARKAQKFEQSFQLYREAGSGANGGKSGGGCGCN
jgi:hypothetical protein